MNDEAVAMWDAEAPGYDGPADHGLRDPVVRVAWRDLLLEVLPPAPARIADLGCGTATLSVLLADQGYTIDGVDFSPAMVELARAKAFGRLNVTILEGDAAAPPLASTIYDVVLCRHVLWALPDRPAALRRWLDLLRPEGRLVLVEGSWSTGAGLTADDTVELLAEAGRSTTVTPLEDRSYWNREISDERYLVVSLS